MSVIQNFQDFKQRYPIQPNNKEMILGRGTYGTVVKVEDQITNEWVAIKISEYKGIDRRSLKNEVELNKKVPLHANIAIYKDCFRLDAGINISDFAVMQYYKDGNLSELLKTNNLKIEQKDEIIRGILKGIGHLHSNKIVHRDLKPANILISKDSTGRYIPKIADFGLSKIINQGDIDNSDFGMSDGAGTPSYKAPEQIIGSEAKYNLDLWAFGVILYELINGDKPFQVIKKEGTEQSSKLELEKKIVNVILPETQLNTTPQPYQTIIRRCLVKDINNRARRATELLDILDGVEHLYLKAAELLKIKDFQSVKSVCFEILDKKENDNKAQEFLNLAEEGINSEKIAIFLDKAKKFEDNKEFSEAISIYENLNPQTEYIKSRILACQNEINIIQETEIHIKKGEAYLQREDFENANEAFESALKLSPKNKQAKIQYNISSEKNIDNKIVEAQSFANEGKYNESIKLLTVLQLQNSNISRIRSELEKNKDFQNLLESAESYFKSHDYDKALQYYNELFKKNPNHKSLKTKINECEVELGKLIIDTETTDIFDEKTEIAPIIQTPSISQLERTLKDANILFSKNNWIEAKYKYEKVLSLDFGNAIAQDRIKLCDKNLLNNKETRKTIALSSFGIFVFLGIVYFAINQNKNSETINKQLEPVISGGSIIHEIDDSHKIDNTKRNPELKPETKEVINNPKDKIVEKNKNLYNSNIRLAQNSFTSGDYDKSIFYAKKALDIMPNDRKAFDIINNCQKLKRIADENRVSDIENKKVEKINKLILNAREAFKKGDDLTAKANCEAALALEPDDNLKKEINKILKAISLSN